MTTIQAAPLQLAELVCTMREDWDRTEVDGAIHACGLNGWTWEQTAQTAVHLACSADQFPRDLVEAARKPLEHRPALGPDRNAEAAEQARQLLARPRQTESTRHDHQQPEGTQRVS
jgi:hypothetical protein